MHTQSYNKLCDIIYRQSGIRIREGKSAMISSRLAGRIKALALEDEQAYVAYLEKAMSEEIDHLLDAVSTNMTSFFRESPHFDLAGEVMRRWLAEGRSKFRCWSAASSSGEEVYTLGMVLKEAVRAEGALAEIKILGTDINHEVLATANAAAYPPNLVERIPADYRTQYFNPPSAATGGRYKVKPEVRSMMTFRRLNLSKPPFPMKGPMDMIFCRNVMIYFDEPVRNKLIREFHRLLRPGGYLFVGHSEGIRDIDGMFKSVASSAYEKLEG